LQALYGQQQLKQPQQHHFTPQLELAISSKQLQQMKHALLAVQQQQQHIELQLHQLHQLILVNDVVADTVQAELHQQPQQVVTETPWDLPFSTNVAAEYYKGCLTNKAATERQQQ